MKPSAMRNRDCGTGGTRTLRAASSPPGRMAIVSDRTAARVEGGEDDGCLTNDDEEYHQPPRRPSWGLGSLRRDVQLAHEQDEAAKQR